MNDFPKFSKIANQQPPHHSPPTTSQETLNNPQSSTRISFQDNPYTFEERHARLSEPLEPVIRQASLSEPQCEPVYNIYPLSNRYNADNTFTKIFKTVIYKYLHKTT